jgi:ectoine hydroxylase-related dioxygenase (phytanoyl-CoA dioxygenase family)
LSLQIPWVESPFFEAELQRRDLSAAEQEMARSFHDDGFLVLRGAVAAELTERVVGESRPLLERALPDLRVMDIWKECPAVRELAALPAVLDVLALLYGRRPIPFQTLNFEVGTQQPPHADSVHFSCLPRRYMCGAWTALEDITADNGPLVYYPGSHRLPELGPNDFGESPNTWDNEQYERFVGRLLEAHNLEAREFHCQRGDVLIWSANLVHGGRPIRDHGSTRWSQATHYFFEDCIYFTPLMSNVDTGELMVRRELRDIGSGELVESSYNGRSTSYTPLTGERGHVSIDWAQ